MYLSFIAFPLILHVVSCQIISVLQQPPLKPSAQRQGPGPFVQFSCPRPFRYLATCRTNVDCRTGCCAKFSLRPIREWSAECCVPRPLVRLVNSRGWCLEEEIKHEDLGVRNVSSTVASSNDIQVECPPSESVKNCEVSCTDNMSCSPEEICCPNSCSKSSCISSFHAARFGLQKSLFKEQ